MPYTGTTPYTVDLPPGNYVATLTKEGYATATENFTITADQTTTLDVVMSQILGTLSLTSSPTGVNVSITSQ